MVDRKRRQEMAELLRHFASGLLTVDAWEERTEDIFDQEDRALSEIWFNVWCVYDDFRTERLRDEWQLTGETRKTIARCILFLYLDEEFRWERPTLKERFSAWLRLQRPPRYRVQGDEQCWPFFTQAEFQQAKQKPPLLAATRL